MNQMEDLQFAVEDYQSEQFEIADQDSFELLLNSEIENQTNSLDGEAVLIEGSPNAYNMKEKSVQTDATTLSDNQQLINSPNQKNMKSEIPKSNDYVTMGNLWREADQLVKSFFVHKQHLQQEQACQPSLWQACGYNYMYNGFEVPENRSYDFMESWMKIMERAEHLITIPKNEVQQTKKHEKKILKESQSEKRIFSNKRLELMRVMPTQPPIIIRKQKSESKKQKSSKFDRVLSKLSEIVSQKLNWD